jgi:hypothetical protein
VWEDALAQRREERLEVGCVRWRGRVDQPRRGVRPERGVGGLIAQRCQVVGHRIGHEVTEAAHGLVIEIEWGAGHAIASFNGMGDATGPDCGLRTADSVTQLIRNPQS